MQYQLLLKIVKVLCLGTAVHGLGLLSIAPATAVPAPPPPIETPIPTAPVTPATPVGIAPTVKIVAPTPSSVLDLAATTVVIQSRSGTTIELKVNGTLVDNSSIGRTETDAKTNSVTQTWYGVPLNPGQNTIVAKTSQGEVATTTIQVVGTPTKIQLSTLQTRIPADGRSIVDIAGQLLDENNNPSKQDSIITLYTTAGEFAGVDANRDQPGFQIAVIKGKFTAKLRSGLDAQTVGIRAVNLNLEANTQVQFETNLRSSIATGLIDFRLGARGTDYYRSYTEFLPVDRNNNTQLQARGQAFATGRVGDWSVTGAFNSDRPLNKVCDNNDRLFRDTGTQNCESLYPIYGDTSRVDVLTPSRDSVFVKVESSTGVRGSVPNMAMMLC